MSDFYRLFVPVQATGASLKYFDLFNNNGAAQNVFLEVYQVLPIVSGSVAVTGVVGVDLFLQRTTAIGTGGTAATLEGVSPTACSINSMDAGGANLQNISARLTPGGGATAGAVISCRTVVTEETNGGAYTPQFDFVRGQSDTNPPLIVHPGTGFMVIQGSVASVGNIGFDVLFKVRSYS